MGDFPLRPEGRKRPGTPDEARRAFPLRPAEDEDHPPDPSSHMDYGVLPLGVSDDHPVYARVDDEAPAHGAGGGVMEQLAALGLPSGQIEGGLFLIAIRLQ